MLCAVAGGGVGMSPELAIIIVNFRTPGLTIDCLRSLAPQIDSIGKPVRVIVVENGSGDSSAERIAAAIQREGWSAWAQLLPLDRNWGFAGGNNRGIEHAGAAEYYLLLNSDTIVEPRTLEISLAAMRDEPDIGLMSCMLLNADRSWQNTTRRFPTPLSEVLSAFGLPWKLPSLFRWADKAGDRPELARVKHDTDWLGGAFMLIRGEALRALGALDEDFFFLGEDVEFCHRYARAGWRVHYDPASAIIHLGGASSKEQSLPSRRKLQHELRARYLIQRKCYGSGAAVAVRIADVVANALRYGWSRLRRRSATPQSQKQRMILDILLGPESRAVIS